MAIALDLNHIKHINKQATAKKKSADYEARLVQGCLNEERWAQKALYEMYYGRMMGVALRYSNNKENAKDILHEGFIKVFRFLHKYKVGTSLGSWIRRIVINTSIDFYRKEIRHKSENIETAYSLSCQNVDAVDQYAAKEILAVVQKLPPAYRAVFNLYVVEGYPHKEVAAQLGITESTSRSNLVKARKKLRTLLTLLYK